MLSQKHARFRILGWLEGGSLLVLLFVAMPLKYLVGVPLGVRIVGPIHGLFFTAYCITLIDIHIQERWPLKETILFFICALLPFGTFALDQRLRNNLGDGLDALQL